MRLIGISLVLLLLASCGQYGRTNVPSSPSCDSLCDRIADCTRHLCNVDTNTNSYDSLEPMLYEDCMSDCQDADIELFAEQLPVVYECVFESSCREVFADDICESDSYYVCM